MWWSRSIVPVVFCGLLLTGCGFHPLYGTAGGEAATGQPPAELTQVRVEPIANRLGQQLRNELLDRLNPRGAPADPDYRLQVQLTTVTEKLAVQKSEIATRANLRLTATYTLRDRNGKAVFRGSSFVVSSYNILTADYATLIAEKDAANRAVRNVAGDIEIRLALFFRRRGADGSGPPS